MITYGIRRVQPSLVPRLSAHQEPGYDPTNVVHVPLHRWQKQGSTFVVQPRPQTGCAVWCATTTWRAGRPQIAHCEITMHDNYMQYSSIVQYVRCSLLFLAVQSTKAMFLAAPSSRLRIPIR